MGRTELGLILFQYIKEYRLLIIYYFVLEKGAVCKVSFMKHDLVSSLNIAHQPGSISIFMKTCQALTNFKFM